LKERPSCPTEVSRLQTTNSLLGVQNCRGCTEETASLTSSRFDDGSQETASLSPEESRAEDKKLPQSPDDSWVARRKRPPRPSNVEGGTQ
jgi:hypothetical protein